MKRTNLFRTIAVILCAAGSAWVYTHRPEPPAPPQPVVTAPGPAAEPTNSPAPATEAPSTNTPVSPAPQVLKPLSPAPTPTLSPAPQSPGDTPRQSTRIKDELEQVEFALRDFRNALGENPVGTNAEIVRALLGENSKQVKIELPQGSSLNASGELCDSMGTPYFFHQLSFNRMEIRSAGPDHIMWTADDLLR